MSDKNKYIIGVAGNPNTGKTTLFNGLTGSSQKTGNWAGVTVEKKSGKFEIDGTEVEVVDIPGIYSLTASSEDERVARDYVLSGEPQLILNVLDASNIERNLYLSTNIIEMQNTKILIVLNMMDIAKAKGIKIDLEKLERELGVPVIGVSGTDKNDVEALKHKIVEVLENKFKYTKTKLEYLDDFEDIIEIWSPKLTPVSKQLGVNERWVAIKILERDMWIIEKVTVAKCLTNEEIKSNIQKIESRMGEETDILMAEAKYGFITGICKSVVTKEKEKISVTERIDNVALHKYIGIPVFFLIMYLMFWAVIQVGGAFIDFFDILFGAVFVEGLKFILSSLNTPEWLTTIVADGMGAGVQTVATFIPLIFTMFFILSVLEDSGYIARAAFVMDRFMRAIGLPGKAFVPLIVGFGCTVPAIMATRTLENKRDRLLTIFMAPLMSCGARMPVYALFGAAFFGKNSGLMVFAIYMSGILLAVLTGLLLKKTLFKGEASYFVMELPSYHLPRFGHIFFHTWMRLKIFIIKAGKFIVPVVALLGVLNSFGIDGTFGNENSERSVLAIAGKSVTPIFEPMGIEKQNWPAAVGLFTGIFAKEAVVGTLNSLYSQNSASETEDTEPFNLGNRVVEAFLTIPENLKGVFGGILDPLGIGIVSDDENAVAEETQTDASIFQTMRKNFSKGPMQAFAYVLFILIYFPCIAAFGAIMREAGKFYGWLAVSYLTVLAWITSTLFYQITVGHEVVFIVTPIIMFIGIVILFKQIAKMKI